MLSSRLKELRSEKGLSQKELAKSIHMSQQAIARYEVNTATPNPETLLSLASFFDVSIDYLLGLSDTKKALAADEGSEVDKELQEIIDIMEELPKNERKRALRFLRAAFADMQEEPSEQNDPGE